MIPKLIHQIWFQGKENIPDHLKVYHQSWVENNPDYNVIVWDEKNINKEVNLFFDIEIRNMYYSYPNMIQKIDLAKYIILYKYGGIYIDMDSKSLKRINDSLFEHYDLIVSKLPDKMIFKFLLMFGGISIFKETINNGAIIATPENKAILDTIYEAKKNKDSIYKNINKTLYVYITTGPICLTNAIYNHKKQNEFHKIKIIDKTYFEGCDLIEIENGECKIPDNAIGIHLYENSWVPDNENFIKKMYIYILNNITTIIFSIIFITIFIVILYYTLKNKSFKVFLKNKKLI